MSAPDSNKIVTVEINGVSVKVPEGTTVLKAAQKVGVELPTLCYMKDALPDGSCRMCVVEIEGRRGLQIGCAAECYDGMKVLTHSPKVNEARRFVLDLLLSKHERKCFVCPQNSKCKLQEYCMEYGVERSSFRDGYQISAPIDTTNPFFDFDPNLCINCHTCSRICGDVQGRKVIGNIGRGFSASMGPAYYRTWDTTKCESCGNCVYNCPTGALSTKASKKYREWSLKKVLTTCPNCATGCQMNLLIKNNKVVGVEPADGPSNKNLLCVKGRFAYNFINHPDRLKYPLIKRNGVFERATWDEALDLIASKLKEIKEKHGADAIAGFSCSRTVNEDNYVFQKMMRAGIGTNNVDQCARLCHSATVHGLAMTLGSGAMTNTIEDITHTDVILLIGSNTTEAHPVIGSQIRQAAMRGTKIIVIDPRKIDLVNNAKLHLQLKPGTNIAILNAMMNYILAEGLEDKDFIANKTEGFEEFKEILKDYSPEKMAEVCGVDAEAIKEAARMYATAEKASIIYCLGVTEHSQGTEGVMSTSNLALLCGKIGKEGCGVNPLRGQNNVQGACDMGCMPGDFPGYQKVTNPEVMEKFEKAWGVELNKKPGLMMTDVIPAAIKGDIKALYIMGEDPVVTDPDTNHLLKAINNLEFFAIQEIFMTETAQLADVVLPATCYAEKEGTFSNTERRVQRVRKAVEPEGEVKQDWEILCEIMTRMGYPCHYNNAAEIMDEIASLTPIFGGISHERLDSGESIQWPCPTKDHPGTKIMHVGKFSRGEKALIYPAAYSPSKELPDEEYPFTLMTGRMLYHYNTRAMTGKTEGINKIANESYIEINPEDAARLGIADGEKVKVSSRRGELVTKAVVTEKVNVRETFMTFHFPDGNANWVTNSATDAIAKIPDYKVCAIKIEKLD